MPLIIPDETLKAAGLTEREARVEIACRLFAAEKLALWPAAQLAGMSRDQFVAELHNRDIDPYRYGAESLRDDLRRLARRASGE